MPSGPKDSRLVIIGEAPGSSENAMGKPFCGQSGKELDNVYLPAAGMPRDRVLVSNAVCCQPEGQTPSAELVRHCSSKILLPWLDTLRQDAVILCLGRVSASVVFGGEVPEPGVAVRRGDRNLIYAPHPASAMRDESRTGEIMDSILLSFSAAGRILYGLGQPEPTPYTATWEDDWMTAERILGDAPVVGFDTESMGIGGRAFCASIAARRGDEIRSVVVPVQVWDQMLPWLLRRRVVMHHSLHDAEVVAKVCGWEMAHQLLDVCEDTMLLAYEIRGLPLGLKPLSSVLCGYDAKSYDRVMGQCYSEALEKRMRGLEGLMDLYPRPCCAVTGQLFGGEPIPAELMPEPDESQTEYRNRLSGMEDSLLEPLAGRDICMSVPLPFAAALADEIDARFSSGGAMTAIAEARELLDGTVSGVEKAIRRMSKSTLLRHHMPATAHELIADAGRDQVVAYAALDAVATLAVWEVLQRRINHET